MEKIILDELGRVILNDNFLTELVVGASQNVFADIIFHDVACGIDWACGNKPCAHNNRD